MLQNIVFIINPKQFQLNTTSGDEDGIQRATDHDPILARVKHSISRGWCYNTDNILDAYFRRRAEMTLHQGCLILGMRVVVPEKSRSCIIEVLHEGHVGVVNVKVLA